MRFAHFVIYTATPLSALAPSSLLSGGWKRFNCQRTMLSYHFLKTPFSMSFEIVFNSPEGRAVHIHIRLILLERKHRREKKKPRKLNGLSWRGEWHPVSCPLSTWSGKELYWNAVNSSPVTWESAEFGDSLKMYICLSILKRWSCLIPDRWWWHWGQDCLLR